MSRRPVSSRATLHRGRDLFQHLRQIPRSVQDADDVQPTRRGGDAVENQIIPKPAHRPETHCGQLSAIGLITRADFRPLRQRAKAQLQRGQKSLGGRWIMERDEPVDIRDVVERLLGADDFKRLQVA